MEFKGTPGPWLIESDEFYESQLNIVSDSRPYVATVWPDAFVQSKEQQANAHLIAAAPRMLYAGFALLKALQSGKRITFEEESELEAALMQALGQNNG